MERLGGERGGTWLPRRDTREAFCELVPRWADDATDPPNTFRQHWFGHDADPVDAWGMQRAVLDIRTADTHAKLKQAGTELAEAMRTVGLSKVSGFLRAARKQALLNGSDGALRIQRIAAEEPGKEREEEENAERGIPQPPLAGSHVPGVEEPISHGRSLPKIGGAAGPGKEASTAAGKPGVPTRGQQAERYYGKNLGDDYPSQRSYLKGKEVKYGTPGSVRPDFVSPDGKTASFEVKSYNLTTNAPSKLVSVVAAQAVARAGNLPVGMTQKQPLTSLARLFQRRSKFGGLDRENRRPLEEYDTLDGPPFWLAGA